MIFSLKYNKTKCVWIFLLFKHFLNNLSNTVIAIMSMISFSIDTGRNIEKLILIRILDFLLFHYIKANLSLKVFKFSRSIVIKNG